MGKKNLLDTYQRFKDYHKQYKRQTSEILVPPDIYEALISNIKGRVLDIGTGDGYKLENILKKCDFRKISYVYAIEPSALYFEAKERFKNYPFIEISQKSIEDIESKENYFDTIMMFDVIEHIYNPYEVLKKVVSLLKKDGIFILSTPNSLVYQITERIGGGFIDPTHVSEMGVFSLSKLLRHFFLKVKIKGVLPFMKLGRKFPFILFLNRYLCLPLWARTIYAFATSPKKVN